MPFVALPNETAAQENSGPPLEPPGDDRENALPQGYEFTFPAMGTQVELKAFHHDPRHVQRTFEEVRQKVAALESVLTDYDPNSETRQLTRRATSDFVTVSNPLWQVLVASDRWYRISGGTFDASLGALTQLWRKYRRTPRLPTAAELSSARERTGWQHVCLDHERRSVKFGRDDLRLDFGAIGKGFIADQAFELLNHHGLACSLVNISGNMRAGHPPPTRQGWRIEIAPLERGGQPLRRIPLADGAIATSGDLWQYVMVDGIRRSHILDPRTGLGVEGPVCATVISPTGIDADALATTACILGFRRAAEIARQLHATELLVATKTARAPSEAQDVPASESAAADMLVLTTAGFPV